MNDSLNIALCGATGYVGIELVKILTRHKKIKIIYLCAQKSIGKKISSFEKSLKKYKLPIISEIKDIDYKKINLIFTALPNGQSQIIANKIPSDVKLIDLSADFRLKKASDFLKWYNIKHKSKNLIKDSIYALPEFCRNDIKKYKIIACPGCYPTSIQIPLIPLIKNKLINHKNIIIDAKSGYSGAGKNIKKKFKFKNLYQSVSGYGVGYHRHMAEIDQELSISAKKKIKVFFTPHLLPTFRGILSTIYLEIHNRSSAKTIYNFLKKYHKKNKFIKFAKFNKAIGTGDVINSNNCQISVCKDRISKKIIIFSALDNLIKGAAGQAVQNMNLAYGYREEESLS